MLGFGIEWPYSKPVFVLSSTLDSVPADLEGRVLLLCDTPDEITRSLHERGFQNLYIDGGRTIQRFLDADLIDELIIARLPVILGGGVPLFGALEAPMLFELVGTRVHAGQLVKSHYRRTR